MASINSNAMASQTQAIQMLPASSSFIAAFEYDPTQMRLTTHLKDGAIYQHTFVTGLDWQALQTSRNHSKHWADNIKGKKLSIRVKSAKAPRSEIKRKGR